jgi:hypothetical protein
MVELAQNKYIFDCKTCKTTCDGVSRGTYLFQNDVEYSEFFENKIIDLINSKTGKKAKKTERAGYPDIEVFDEKENVICLIEVKVQRRTFMAVERILPSGNLKPSETIALNLSDLVRYFEIDNKEENIPVFLIWVLSNRPCIINERGCDFIIEEIPHLLFFQNIKKLKEIYEIYGDNRRFRRRSGQGDVVEGVHRGVVVNYHFSLSELNPKINELLEKIKNGFN